MRSIEGLRVGAVYRQATQSTFAAEKAATYERLISRFEMEMKTSQNLAIVFMDGDGSDTSFRDVHRRLARRDRNVIEDPIYTDSKTSQLMQMADHVAWCANASIARVPKHEFSHDWYSGYLSERDLERLPKEI